MITDNFIKMCEKNEDLQREWKVKLGDYFYHKQKEKVLSIGLNAERDWIEKLKKKYEGNYIYLPTLGQLFEMALFLRNKDAHIKAKEYEIMADFIEWMLNADIDRYKGFNLDFDDTKSCVLIYLMESFYHKVWTGSKWVKAK